MTILMQLLLRMQQNRGNVQKHQILQMYGSSESSPRIVIVKKFAPWITKSIESHTFEASSSQCLSMIYVMMKLSGPFVQSLQ